MVFEQHARACGELANDLRLIGVADLDAGKLRQARERFFIPHCVEDYRRLLDRRDIEVITICTPPNTHERIVLDCLEAGKRVLCEKPLAHHLESADRIIAAEKDHSGKLSVVYQFRYWETLLKALWLRDQGYLGDLKYGWFNRIGRLQGSAAGGSGWWGKWGVAGGGVIMTQFIHELDMIGLLFGRPLKVSAVADTLSCDIESEDTASARIRFESGALVVCSCTVVGHRAYRDFEVVGEKASLTFPWNLRCSDAGHAGEMVAALEEVFPPPPSPRPPSIPRRAWRKGLRVSRLDKLLPARRQLAQPATNDHTPYLAEIARAMRENRPLPVGPCEARTSLELATAIYQSALHGNPVQLPLAPGGAGYTGVRLEEYQSRQSADRAV